MSLVVSVKVNGSISNDIRNDLKKKLIDLDTALKQKSPVDTGNFRASWTLDLNKLSIENNSEYAEALAKGHSPQQPQDGWVEDTAKDIFK